MSAIVISERLVHYEVIGRGKPKPLVFIHGWLGSWRYWVPAMEELSSQRRTYALDLWGFGDSDKRQGRYGIDDYVWLLREFLDNLGVLDVTLVGHALGGVVALQFAREFPDQVEGIVGVSVPLTGEAVQRPLASLLDNGGALARLVARRAKFPEVESEALKTHVPAVVESMRSAMASDLRATLRVLKTPVLLVHGGDDQLVLPPEKEWLEKWGDHVRGISLNGARHFPMLEERSKFNRLLLDFLDADCNLESIEPKEEWQRRLR
jgi:pimeloyl-ACP methyl ester carboxylesterase